MVVHIVFNINSLQELSSLIYFDFGVCFGATHHNIDYSSYSKTMSVFQKTARIPSCVYDGVDGHVY